MAYRNFDSKPLRTLLEPFTAELGSPTEHEAEWFAELTNGDPFVHHLRGQTVLEGSELRRAVLNTACGVSSAIASIQGRMAVGKKDHRLTERRRVVTVARLSSTAPTGVDGAAWRHLADLHDPSADVGCLNRAREALDRLEADDPDGFERLMRAARMHDRTVEQLEARALEIEDSLVFSAAARALWGRFLGTEKALEQLPAHVAVFALSIVFEPAQAGGLVASLGLLTISPTADFPMEPTRTDLRKAVDRSLRFWQVRSAGSSKEGGAVHAREFIAAVGDLVRSEQEAGEGIIERAARLGRRRRGGETSTSVTANPEVEGEVMIHRGDAPPTKAGSTATELEVIPFDMWKPDARTDG